MLIPGPSALRDEGHRGLFPDQSVSGPVQKKHFPVWGRASQLLSTSTAASQATVLTGFIHRT
jgi:hypothetical protein